MKMSFFYLSSPRGEMPIHLIETIVLKRLEFLKNILSYDNPVYNEYVIEDSVYDSVGHFMLCIVAVLSEKGFSRFLYNTEYDLFKRRLKLLSESNIRLFAKKLLRTLRKCEEKSVYTEPLVSICQQMCLKHIAQHLTEDHKENCNNHNIKLHFKYCLQFIAKRQVEISKGIASLPCRLWTKYIEIIFSHNLRKRLLNKSVTELKNDPRIMELVKKVEDNCQDLHNKTYSNSNTLLHKNVDSKTKFFPPCMLNLHSNLRNKHRLSHDQRFYYSLFLKDIGMPVEEAVEFWREEYRQIPNKHTCCHNWEKDEKKYLYGIRHMYGLEGARINYTSVSCHRLQSNCNASSEGGCPFKYHNNTNIANYLHIENESELLPRINELRSNNQFTSACKYYLSMKYSNTCDIERLNFTPVNFYKIASNEII